MAPNVIARCGPDRDLDVDSHSASYVIHLECTDVPTVEAPSHPAGDEDESMEDEVDTYNIRLTKRRRV